MFWFWYWAPGGSAFIAVRSVLISPGISAQRLIHHWHISSPQTSETMVSQTGYSTLANINHYPHRSRCWSTGTIPNYITPESQLSDLNGTHTWSIIQNGWLSGMQGHMLLHTKQSSTHNNKYQVSQKHGCFSWWWAHSRPKHVGIDKFIKNKLCTNLVLFTRSNTTTFTFFDILLTVHLNIFILILTNLMH